MKSCQQNLILIDLHMLLDPVTMHKGTGRTKSGWKLIQKIKLDSSANKLEDKKER